MPETRNKKLIKILIPLIVVPIVFLLLWRPEKPALPPDQEIPKTIMLIQDAEKIKTITEKLDEAMRAFQKGDLETAARLYQNRIEENPNDYEAYYGLGSVFIKKKNLQDAEQAFNKAAQINTEFSPTYLSLGYISLVKGNYDEAIKNYEKSLSLLPNLGPAHWGLGLSYFQTGNCGMAIKHLRRVIELMPGFPNSQKAEELISSCDVAK